MLNLILIVATHPKYMKIYGNSLEFMEIILTTRFSCMFIAIHEVNLNNLIKSFIKNSKMIHLYEFYIYTAVKAF